MSSEMATMTAPGVLEGPLNKWTNYVSGWQYRWFVLDTAAGELSYYTGKNRGGKCRGRLSVASMDVSLDEGEDSLFSVVSGSESYFLRAKSDEERMKWVTAINDAKRRLNIERRGSQPSSVGVVGSPAGPSIAPVALTPASLSTLPAGPVPLQTQGPVISAETPTGASRTRAMTTSLHNKLIEAQTYRRLLEQQLEGLYVSLTQNDGAVVQLDTSANLVASDDPRATITVARTTWTAMFRAFDQCLSIIASGEGVEAMRRPSDAARARSGSDHGSQSPGRRAGHRTATMRHASKGGEEDDEDEFYDADDWLSDDGEGNDGSGEGTEGGPSPSGGPTGGWATGPYKDYDPDADDGLSDEDGSNSEHKSVILHLLSQLRIGMDLTKVVLPTFILERRSLLEMYADFFAHADFFVTIPDFADPADRMMQVVRWYLSSFHVGRKSTVAKKPYNPIIGETFRCAYNLEDINCGSLSFIAEQVSHHPPVSAFYAEDKEKGIALNAHIWTKSKFLGMSVGVLNVGYGLVTLTKLGETYRITFPDAYARSILTVPWVELGGKTTITCEKTGYQAQIEFLTKPTFGKPNKITCEVSQAGSEPFARIFGEWNGVMYIKDNKTQETKVFIDTKALPIIRKQVPRVSEQIEFESRRLWKEVTEALRVGDVARATEFKMKLEARQRSEERERKEKNEVFQPALFNPTEDGWMYKTPIEGFMQAGPAGDDGAI